LVGAKIRWIEKNEPEVYRRIATVFGSYDYINWRLTGLRAIEQNWALEAGFVDLTSHALADDLIAFAHVPRNALPPKTTSHAILGHVSADAARETGIAAGTPVIGGAADLIASALGAGLSKPGDVLLKFGGSIDVLIATDKAKPDARMYLDYHLVPGLFMPNGCMSTGGSGLNWFVANFAQGERAAAEDDRLSLHQHLDRMAQPIPAGAEGVTILPYFLGEKTPIHDPAARGMISGLTLSHGLGHLWRAMLESYAYAIRHHIDVLNDMGHRTEHYLVSDGGSNSRVWMQIVADVLQKPLQRLTGHPGSCLGAAWTAAIGTGLTDDWSAITRFVGVGETLQPNADNAAVYDAGYRTFRNLYRPTPV
jgi:xylulokinase